MPLQSPTQTLYKDTSFPSSVTSLNDPDSFPEVPVPECVKSANERIERPLYIFFHCIKTNEGDCSEGDEIKVSMWQKTPSFLGENSEEIGQCRDYSCQDGTFDFGTTRHLQIETRGDQGRRCYIEVNLNAGRDVYAFNATVAGIAKSAQSGQYSSWYKLDKLKGNSKLTLQLILTVSTVPIDLQKASRCRMQNVESAPIGSSPSCSSKGSESGSSRRSMGGSSFNPDGKITMRVEKLVGDNLGRYRVELVRQQFKTFHTVSDRVATGMCAPDGTLNPPLVATCEANESTKDRDYLKVMAYEEAAGRGSASKLKFKGLSLRKKAEEMAGKSMASSLMDLDNGMQVRLSFWSGSSKTPPGRHSSNSNLSSTSKGSSGVEIPILPTDMHMQYGISSDI